MKRAILVLALTITAACATLPPGHSSEAQTAFKKTQVVHALDVIRDTAIDAEKVTLLSTDTTRTVVLWHQSALKTIAASEEGWVATVSTGLSGVLDALPKAEREILRPYISLAQALLKGLTS